jgi:hypothetical protein
MELGGTQYVLHHHKSDVFRIWAVADLHLGNRSCNRKLIQQDLDAIKNDPYSLWVGIGDYGDFISPGDKRFDPTTIASDLAIKDLGSLGRVMTAQVRDLFKPIANKCLGLGFGNHEKKYFLGKEQEDLHQWLCTELGVMNLGYSAFYDLAFYHSQGGKPRLVRTIRGESGSGFQVKKRFFQHHGCGHAVTPGGKLNKLLQFMNGFGPADVYFVGHVHDQTVKRVDKLGANADCTRQKVHKKVGLITGGYLQAYAPGQTSYAEMAGYLPTVMGSVYVTIDPERDEMRASI